ncbi:hypothetical protein VFPPC_17360 [Pochonia chlamydosporia 170]|uniref:Uncharacterized protein n=1 Tax=Pochonia chlamydosporia 170 TaxID=1380566 RepID=A0A219ARU8_METCM|nr:hypothetical protein VFPPC_17360 [Pochonia chlamydosporia 170]OWT43491.1 hypothetical protein VFPPC_17360 [Pochonia chlamydosporia 170]
MFAPCCVGSAGGVISHSVNPDHTWMHQGRIEVIPYSLYLCTVSSLNAAKYCQMVDTRAGGNFMKRTMLSLQRRSPITWTAEPNVNYLELHLQDSAFGLGSVVSGGNPSIQSSPAITNITTLLSHGEQNRH